MNLLDIRKKKKKTEATCAQRRKLYKLRFQFDNASISAKTITLYKSHLKLQKKQPFFDLKKEKKHAHTHVQQSPI